MYMVYVQYFSAGGSQPYFATGHPAHGYYSTTVIPPPSTPATYLPLHLPAPFTTPAADLPPFIASPPTAPASVSNPYLAMRQPGPPWPTVPGQPTSISVVPAAMLAADVLPDYFYGLDAAAAADYHYRLGNVPGYSQRIFPGSAAAAPVIQASQQQQQQYSSSSSIPERRQSNVVSGPYPMPTQLLRDMTQIHRPAPPPLYAADPVSAVNSLPHFADDMVRKFFVERGFFSVQLCNFITCKSSYCFQRNLAITILSVHLSHGWISQKRCKLGSPNLHCRLPGRLQFQEL